MILLQKSKLERRLDEYPIESNTGDFNKSGE